VTFFGARCTYRPTAGSERQKQYERRHSNRTKVKRYKHLTENKRVTSKMSMVLYNY